MEITEFCTYLAIEIGITTIEMAMATTILEVLEERRGQSSC